MGWAFYQDAKQRWRILTRYYFRRKNLRRDHQTVTFHMIDTGVSLGF